MSEEHEKAKRVSDMDQALATISENFPPMWRRMFENFKTEGFTEEQALRLVCTHVHAVGNGRLS